MNKLFNPNKLLLQELKDIAYATPRPLRWAMVWFLLWLEPRYIDYKSKQSVDLSLIHISEPTRPR